MVKVKFIAVTYTNSVAYFLLGDTFVHVHLNGLRDWSKGTRVVGRSI